MATSASGGAGGSMCEPPLVMCPGGCVDLQTDIANCGQCGRYCLSEICVNGECEGQTVGHIVVIGMSYAQASQPMRVLLGNALFLPPDNPIKVAEWRQYADVPTATVVDEVVESQASLRGLDLTRKTYTQDTLADALLNEPTDVLLVHDQSKAPVNSLGGWGASHKDALQSFSAAGGVIVVLASTEGTAQMDDWLSSSGVLDVQGMTSVTGQQLVNEAPGHAVGLFVLSPFLSKPQTVTFDIVADPRVLVTSIIRPKMGTEPVVVHRIESR